MKISLAFLTAAIVFFAGLSIAVISIILTQKNAITTLQEIGTKTAMEVTIIAGDSIDRYLGRGMNQIKAFQRVAPLFIQRNMCTKSLSSTAWAGEIFQLLHRMTTSWGGDLSSQLLLTTIEECVCRVLTLRNNTVLHLYCSRPDRADPTNQSAIQEAVWEMFKENGTMVDGSSSRYKPLFGYQLPVRVVATKLEDGIACQGPLVGGDPSEWLIPFVGAIRIGTDPYPDNYYGGITLLLGIADIQRRMELERKKMPFKEVNMFFIDSRGLIVGSTHNQPFFTLTPGATQLPNSTVEWQCFTVVAAGVPPAIGCLRNASHFPFGPLQSILAQNPQFLGGDFAGMLSTNVPDASGEMYSTFVRRTSLVFDKAGRIDRFLLLVFVREAEYSEKLSESIVVSISISVTAACIVIIVVVLIVVRITKPFALLSEQFHEAAVMRIKDPSTSSISGGSWVMELNQLQRSTVLLLRSLFVLKPFLPQVIMTNSAEKSSKGDLLAMSNFSNPFAGFEEDEEKEEEKEKDGQSTYGVDDLVEPLPGAISIRKLHEKVNTFKKRRCSVVLVSCPNLPLSNRHQLKKALDRVAPTFAMLASQHGGSIESLNPETLVASFNAQSSCAMHERSAVSFAKALLPSLPTPKSVVVIDTLTSAVGNCGAKFIARVAINATIVASQIAELAQTYIGSPLIVTERAARKLQGEGLLPVDRVLLANAVVGEQVAPLTLYEIISVTRPQLDGSVASTIRKIFVHLTSPIPNLAEARELLGTITPPQRDCANGATVARLHSALNSMALNSSQHADAVTAKRVIRKQRASPWSMVGNEAYIDKSDDDSFQVPRVSAAAVHSEGIVAATATTSASTVVKEVHASWIPLQFEDLHGTLWTRCSAAHIKESSKFLSFQCMSQNGTLALGKAVKSAPTQEELWKELLAVCSLRHDNIVSYLSGAVLSGCGATIIVVEYVAGGSMLQLREQFGLMPTSVVEQFAIDILEGLQFLHKRHVVHGSISPRNILLGLDGVVKLASCGDALLTCFQAKSRARTEMVFYMAPEVARGKPQTTASDIWSLGITLFELFFGRLPWTSEQVQQGERFAKELAKLKEPPSIPQRKKNVLVLPKSWGLMLELCLSLDANERPTVEQLLEAC